MAEGEVFDVGALVAAANPWWRTASTRSAGADVPALASVLQAVLAEQAPPLLVIEGERQTGKSTLLAALVDGLLETGLAPYDLCATPLDHSPLRWCPAEQVEAAWQAQRPQAGTREVWLVDDLHLWSEREQDALAQLALLPGRTVVVAGLDAGAWVTRWRSAGLRVAHQRLVTANFAQYLAARGIAPELPPAPRSLRELFDWPRPTFLALGASLRSLALHFQDYLRQGGFPGALHAPDGERAQLHLRETVIARMLRWDGPARHGVRRGADLELALACLAVRAGTLLDIPELCQHMTVERPTVRHFLDLLEEVGLLRRIPPLGYGATVQRARFLICLPDPALAGAVLHWPTASGLAPEPPRSQVESALFRHLQGAYGRRGAQISYATLGRRGHTLLVESGRQILPFGHHHPALKVSPRALSGLIGFCAQQGLQRAYLATGLAEDFGPLLVQQSRPLALMRIPAALLCLWLAAAEPGGFDPG